MTISVRPSPRSVRTTVTSSYASSPGWSETVKTSRSGSATSRYSPFQWISRRSGPANLGPLHEPPSLTSMETVDTGPSASLPPYQSAKRSGSVHSFQTRSRGASKTRVIVIPTRSLLSRGGLSAILGFILTRFQARVEAVEASLPEPAVALEPVDGVLERLGVKPRGTELPPAPPRDQPGALQHLEVFGDRLDADRERLRQLVHRGVALREATEDGA